MRHSYATAALKAGISAKVISERLGHASVAFTLQTYSHVIPDPSANNGPQSDTSIKEVKDKRSAQGRDLNPRPLGL